ncbi:MAG: hypothetical protein Q4F35_03055 [Akkermansia sp.]|nr:hypothetical protein [Akkermansia sp.]
MKKVPSVIWGTGGVLLVLMSAGVWAEEEGDATVEGVFGYGEKTVEVETAQDLAAAVDSKNNFTVLLKRDITVTDQVPVQTELPKDPPCWGQSHLFNLSNYVFRPMWEQVILNLSFAPTAGATVGKVVRNGKAEFCRLGNLSFSGIHNVTADTEGTFTPFQPMAAGGVMVAAASDTTSCSGYGGVFRSVSDLVTGEDGGVYIHDNGGAVDFRNICYDGSSMGDVNCGINLKGGAIYADAKWNVEINRNGHSMGGGVNFENVSIALDRSEDYSRSSQCYFYAYGGAIYTGDLKMDDNHDDINFINVGIYQTAVHQDEGYAYGGALYLHGDSSVSRNEGDVNFLDGGVEVANTAKGGAIYLSDGATLAMEGNGGAVNFERNVATASAIDGILNDDALAQGGAVYLGSSSRLSVRGNEGKVLFSDNVASATVSQQGASSGAAGGAIWGAAGSVTDISNNGSVSFVKNRAAVGSAIYTQGTLSVRNNESVLFRDNEGEHAVHLEGQAAVLELSAAAGGKICFEDSVYVEGKADLNADYEGVVQQGDIEFMASEGTFLGQTNLYNGTLRLKQGSSLNVNKLRLMSAGAELAAEGKENSIMGIVDMAEGCTLALTLNDYNKSAAVLVLDGIMSTNGYYTLDVAFNGVPTVGTEYILLDLKQYGYAESAWNEQKVHVTGDVSFAELEWQNDYTRLVYRVLTVPEPTATTLSLLALGALAARRRRR